MKKYINDLNLVEIPSKVIKDILDSNNKKFNHCVFYNTHSYILSLKDNTFMRAILNTKDIFADGIGVLLASKIFDKKKVVRVTGYDFFENLLHEINNSKKNLKLFFLGGSEDNLIKLKNLISYKYTNIDKRNIYIFAPPYGKNFNYKDKDTVDLINRINPDIIFVGLGAPKQEKWVYLNKKDLNCNNYLSIGAAFNFFTGLERRAPSSFRKYGFEWLFRLITNPKKIYKRVFLSGSIFIYLMFVSYFFKKNFYNLNPIVLNVKLVKNFKTFDWSKGYILSALNLASLSFLYKGDIKISKNIFFWGDGIFHKLLISNSKKIAGRELINIIQYPSKINTLHVIGNLTEKTKYFLQSKFKDINVVNSNLPYGNIDFICKNLPLVKENELIFLTLPTPKQEQAADYYHKINLNTKIVCIGGGLAIAAGDEKEVPQIFDFLGLEWLWRLRYETKRRLKRLITSAYYMVKYLLFGKYLKKIFVEFF